MEYFTSVLASDGNLSRGALRNGNLLFADHFVHNISVARCYTKRTIAPKCRAQMKKATVYQMSRTTKSVGKKWRLSLDATNH